MVPAAAASNRKLGLIDRPECKRRRLAGLVELEPWLRQWHADPQPGYAGTPADFFTGLIDTELAALGTDRATLDEIRGVGRPT